MWGPGASLRAFVLVSLLPNLGGSQGGAPGQGDGRGIRCLLAHLGSTLGGGGCRRGLWWPQARSGDAGWRVGGVSSKPCFSHCASFPWAGACPPLWPQFPHREQRVGLAGCPLGGGGWGPFLSPWASGKPCTSLSSAPVTCTLWELRFSQLVLAILVRNVGAACSCSVVSDSLRPPGCSPPGSSVHGILQAVGCPALLQGIFPTQESKQGLLYCRQILYFLSHQGGPGIMEWVAYRFSRGSSPNWGLLHCRFFTS